MNPSDFICFKWHPEIKRFCPDAPYILVGTKIDYRDDPSTPKELAKVRMQMLTPVDGDVLAQRINAELYLECSSKNLVSPYTCCGVLEKYLGWPIISVTGYRSKTLYTWT